MATGRQVDTTLVIRAKDEATRAINTIAGALQDLGGAQRDLAAGGVSTAEGLQRIVTTLAGLDKAYAGLANTVDEGARALDRQSANLDKQQAALAAYERQLKSAKAVQQSMNEFVGPPTKEMQANFAAVGTEIKRLEGAISPLQREVGKLEGNFQRSTSTLAAMVRETRLADAAITLTKGAVEAETRSLREQETARQALIATMQRQNVENAEAARNARAAQSFFNAKATTPATGLSAEDSAAVFQRNGLTEIEKEIAATQRAERAERDRADAIRLTEAALRARARLEGNGGTAGPAKDTALAQMLREEEQAANDAAAAEEELVAAAQRLRAQLDPLAAIQAKLNVELEEVNRLYRTGKINVQELAAAELLLKKNADAAAGALGRTTGGKPTLFGLKPYDIQNLSFQINDIFTQLASGTSLTQTLAQQGGQLLQIFPKFGSSLLAFFKNPAALAFAATIGVIVLGLTKAAEQAEKLNRFGGFLTSLADGGRETAQTLAAVSKELDRYGLSAEEAVKVSQTLFKAGFNAEQIADYGTLAKNLADILGIDVVQATDRVAEAFTGSYDALQSLMQQTQSFTPAQQQQIRLLYDQGRAADGARMAFDILSKKMQESADLARSDWSEAFRSLGNAWDKLTERLGDTWWAKGSLDAVNALARALDGLAGSSRSAAEAERDRQNAAVPATELTADQWAEVLRDPNAGPRVAAEARGAKKDSDEATTQQQANAARLTTEAERREILERKITSQAAVQAKLNAIAAEEYEKLGNSVSKTVADELVALKVRGERVKLEKELADYLKQQAAEREAAIQQFNSRVIGAEGGSAANPFSSATGFGQFLNGTWLEQFKKVFADQAKGMSDNQILALRQNQTVAKAIIDNYARENARFLEGFGAKVTAGNLYLTHFLGPAGAKKILTAPGSTPVNQLLSPEVMNANTAYLKPSGRPRTAKGLIDFIAGRVGDTGAVQTGGQVEITRLIEDAKKKQDDFNQSVRQANEDRQRQVDALTTENKLRDEALIAAQRKTAVDKAEFDLRQKVEDVNKNLKPGQDQVQLTQDQIDKTRELAGTLFDVQRARELAQVRRDVVDRPVNEIAALRDQIQQQIQFAQERGETGRADQLEKQLIVVNARLQTATASAIAFYQALTPGTEAFPGTREELDGIIQRLQFAQEQSVILRSVLGIAGQQIAQTFATTATNALDGFAESIANGANAFESLGRAFLQFAADFLRQIAQMIIQQQIFNLVSGLLKIATPALGGAGGGSSLGAIAGLKAHQGGIIGGAGPKTVPFNPAWLANARRFHTGGVVGLRSDEVPAILQRGEEVLTASDPRHQANGGGTAGSGLTVVNAVDGTDALEKALRSRRGEKVILNYIRDNAGAVEQALGRSGR